MYLYSVYLEEDGAEDLIIEGSFFRGFIGLRVQRM